MIGQFHDTNAFNLFLSDQQNQHFEFQDTVKRRLFILSLVFLVFQYTPVCRIERPLDSLSLI
jgi:hypothetical protein